MPLKLFFWRLNSRCTKLERESGENSNIMNKKASGGLANSPDPRQQENFSGCLGYTVPEATVRNFKRELQKLLNSAFLVLPTKSFRMRNIINTNIQMSKASNTAMPVNIAMSIFLTGCETEMHIMEI